MNAISPRTESSPPSKPTLRSPLPANGSSLPAASFTLPSHRPHLSANPQIILPVRSRIKTQLTFILNPKVVHLTIHLTTIPPTAGGPTATHRPATPPLSHLHLPRATGSQRIMNRKLKTQTPHLQRTHPRPSPPARHKPQRTAPRRQRTQPQPPLLARRNKRQNHAATRKF